MDIKEEVEVGFGDTAVLEFHLTGIQHAIKKSIMMRAGGLSALIDEEVKRAFSPERLKASIAQRVKEEFEASLRYGDGARQVQKIVAAQIAKTLAKLAEDE